ncbi:hypothetical protein Q361_10853 [Flavobacterium croceum DSM 17960]|uniref:Uncharacterized protein n=1 Tax=Flavobacterium croceum DSM 17960 TaxID=1121886 RepID=A0A2S4N7Q9_9FLAO|nr:hypothetical protein Q361_10853 [Flavobacterium croceum DSM 17960]
MNEDKIFYEAVSIYIEDNLKVYSNKINENKDNLEEVRDNFIKSCRFFLNSKIKELNFIITDTLINDLQNRIQLKSNELK